MEGEEREEGSREREEKARGVRVEGEERRK